MSDYRPARIWHPFTQMKTDPDPIHIDRGEGVYLYDDKGNSFIDAISSWWVNIHGHANPVIARAVYEQALRLEHVIFAGFTHKPAKELAVQLTGLLPAELNNVFFSDNGSTAVEVALKLAVQYHFNRGLNQANRFIAFSNAYHGDTIGAMSAGGRGTFSLPFSKLLFHSDYVDYPATWIGDEGVELREDECIEQIEQLLHINSERYAAVIIEPLVQGAGGMNMCRPEFLIKLRALCNKFDMLLIFDEVMTGFGRTGHWFASVGTGTSPDLICLSKGITGGFLPLSVTITTDAIYNAFFSDDRNKTFFHGHSYTANPLACAAAVASIDMLVKNPELFTGMEDKHKYHARKFEGLDNIRKLRICGTIAAWQVQTAEKSEYLNPLAPVLKKKFLDKGVFIRPLGNTIYLMPPYIITDEQLEHLYDVSMDVMMSLPH